MAEQLVLGRPFTFQVLFEDNAGFPVAVDNPQITVFRFNEVGVKVTLLDAVAMQAAVPAEVGRYILVYIPTTPVFQHGDTAYADIQATLAGQPVRDEQSFSVIDPTATGGSSTGLVARLVK